MGTRRNRVIYISHGGGPLPVLGDEGHRELVANLRHLAASMPRPSGILVISAHWEEERPSITAGAFPPLLYDYYGFPQESYELEYPAPGHPELGRELAGLLAGAGPALGGPTFDEERGFDHGLFIPLLLMYPEADIPCAQLSLLKGLDPARHLALGEALAGLRDENLLIVGSGFSFHNMRAFFTPDTAETSAQNEAFDRWLVETCSSPTLSASERASRLASWQTAPHARYNHPREEHLLPLHVCVGATRGRACAEVFDLRIMGKKACAFRW